TAPLTSSTPPSSAGFAGATLSWGEVRKGGEAPLRGNSCRPLARIDEGVGDVDKKVHDDEDRAGPHREAHHPVVVRSNDGVDGVRADARPVEIGRASCRERVWVSVSAV